MTGGERTAQSSHSPTGRPIGRYVIAALGLIAIMVVAALVHNLLRPRVERPPAEFLPSSTRAAVAIDLRPDGPAMRTMKQVWSKSDMEHLARRATDLSQEMVEWTGLKLDVRKDASPWFGGEVVVGTFAGEDTPAFAPRAMVMIARVTSMRQARNALDRAVKPMAKELEWRRLIARRAGSDVIVWRDPMDQAKMAYATRDGCAIASPSLDAVETCLLAARNPKGRLIAGDAFRRSFARLPGDTVMWMYLDVGQAAQVARRIVTGLQRGWFQVLRQFSRGSLLETEDGEQKDAGSLAIAAAPVKDGLRLKAVYAWAKAAAEKPGGRNRLGELASLLPKTTVAYALAHRAQRLMPAGSRQDGEREGRPPSMFPFAFLGPMAGARSLPENLLVVAVARPDGEQTGVARDRAIVVAAPTEEMTLPARLFLAALLRKSVSADIGEFSVLATDEETLDQCRRALEQKGERLPGSHGSGRELEMWAQPSRVSGTMGGIAEMDLTAWESDGGGEGEMVIKAAPGKLLGGG